MPRRTAPRPYQIGCLLTCTKKVGQERFLVLTTPESYKNHVKGMFKGSYEYNFSLGQIHVDEFHNTKSDTAATPTLISDYKKEQSDIITGDPDHRKRKHRERTKDLYKMNLPYVGGCSATPWSKSFTDMAAMVGAIEQPWWADERDMSKMTGKVCRAIGRRIENMEAHLHGLSDDKLK